MINRATITRSAATFLLGAALAVLGGCGMFRGYAPQEVPVHSGSAARGVAGVQDSLRVVCWNIQYGERVGLALSELRAYPELARADILLLQEMDREGVEMMADSLGMHYVYGTASVSPHHQKLFGNAILSRWPIVNKSAETLPHPTPGSGHRRISIAADIELGDGLRMRAVSVHTATVIMEQDKRMDQAVAVLDSLADAGLPLVVAGDFNTVTDYDVILLRRVARYAGYRHLKLPKGPTIVNRYKKFPGSASVLDHVIFRGLEEGSRGVVRTTLASDHFPVWATFAWPGRSEIR